MPVRKFRSIEEMNQAVWREPGDPSLEQAIRALWQLGKRTSRTRFRPGVYRFRTISEMQSARADISVSRAK